MTVTKLQIFALFFISEGEGVGIVKIENPNFGKNHAWLNKKITKNPVRRGRDRGRGTSEGCVEHPKACYAPSISLLMAAPLVLT